MTDLEKRRDTALLSLLGKIEDRGWAFVSVHPTLDEPGIEFSYTVGLTALGHPELAIYGLPGSTAGTLLNIVGERIKDHGAQLNAGDRLQDVIANDLDIAVLAMSDLSDLTQVHAVYGVVDAALQLVWPGRNGRMPWESGYSIKLEAQPLLGPTPGDAAP